MVTAPRKSLQKLAILSLVDLSANPGSRPHGTRKYILVATGFGRCSEIGHRESSHDTSSTGDKPPRSISRLYLSGSSRRPRTSQGPVTPSGSIEGRRRTLSGLQDTGQVLPEASPITPPIAEEAPTLQPDKNVLQQIGSPDLDGWLRKKGERYNTWKLRYFVLKGPHLYYLRSKMVRILYHLSFIPTLTTSIGNQDQGLH